MRFVTPILGLWWITIFGASADLLVSFEFQGYTGDEVEGTSTVMSVVGVMEPSLILRGAGVTLSNNADRFNGRHFTETSLANAIAANDYFAFTMEASAGYSLSVTNITFNFEHSPSGADDWALRSSLDSFASNLDSYIGLGAAETRSSDLSGSGLTNLSNIEFRFYGYGATNTGGSSGFEGSGADILVYGTAVIPEPMPIALCAVGLLLSLQFRRRKFHSRTPLIKEQERSTERF